MAASLGKDADDFGAPLGLAIEARLRPELLINNIRSRERALEINAHAQPGRAKYQSECNTDHTWEAIWVGNMTPAPLRCITGRHIAVQYFFLISWALAVSVALLPIVLFLACGWRAREAEFINKVHDQTPNMEVYFDKFWSEGRAQYPTADPSSRALFRTRYRHLIGRRYYIVPCVLFVLLVSVLTGLVVASAIRTGYDHYIGYFADVAKTEADAAKTGVIGDPITLQRVRTTELDADFAPLPQIQLSLSALSAVAGAYLFVVAGLIRQCRARALVYSDLFGASLRLLVAVPLGLSISTLASDALGPFISFGLGAFPIVELRTLVRRLTATSLKAGDPRADDDQTIAMVGVTHSVSDVLAEENITCAQQLADIDRWC